MQKLMVIACCLLVACSSPYIIKNKYTDPKSVYQKLTLKEFVAIYNKQELGALSLGYRGKFLALTQQGIIHRSKHFRLMEYNKLNSIYFLADEQRAFLALSTEILPQNIEDIKAMDWRTTFYYSYFSEDNGKNIANAIAYVVLNHNLPEIQKFLEENEKQQNPLLKAARSAIGQNN